MFWLLLLLTTTDNIDVRVQMIEDKKFVCFDEPASRDLLELRLTIPNLREKVELLEKQTLLKDAQIEKWSSAYEGMRSQNALLVEDREKLRLSLDAERVWYKHSLLWCVVGAVVGVAIGVTAYTKIR